MRFALSHRQLTNSPAALLPGVGLCILLAVVAIPLGEVFPIIGAPVMGLLLGLVVGNLFTLPNQCHNGIQFGVSQLLKWAIVGLGLKLSIDQLWSVGAGSLSVTLVTLSLAFVTALLLGWWMKLPKRLALLIGAGTAICGGSAIAAIAPIIRANQRDLTLSLTTIFLFNLIAVFLFPAVGHWLGMSDVVFGTWAGTAINDTSSVVAAAYSYSTQAGDIATIVKLTRASLILPVCLVLVAVMAWKHKGEKQNAAGVFPLFIVGFVVAALIHTLGWLPADVEHGLLGLAEFLLIMALVAVGLNSKLKQLTHAGLKPVLLGLCVWAAVAFSSLFVQGVL